MSTNCIVWALFGPASIKKKKKECKTKKKIIKQLGNFGY